MKKFAVLFAVVMLFFVGGCQVVEEIVEKHTETIITASETAVETGAVVTAVNPLVGVWIVALGGLGLAAGNILGLIKKKKK